MSILNLWCVMIMMQQQQVVKHWTWFAVCSAIEGKEFVFPGENFKLLFFFHFPVEFTPGRNQQQETVVVIILAHLLFFAARTLNAEPERKGAS